MTPEHREFTDGLKLAGVAIVCATLTAVVVIGAGEALLRRNTASVGADASSASPPHDG